jgi:hypothetical protein
MRRIHIAEGGCRIHIDVLWRRGALEEMCSGGVLEELWRRCALEEMCSGERSSGGGELLGRCAMEEMCWGGALEDEQRGCVGYIYILYL